VRRVEPIETPAAAGAAAGGRTRRSPLIGVTTSEVRPAAAVHPEEHADPKRPEMALGMTYMRAVERTGGVPVVIPPLHDGAVLQLLDRIDGLLLSGGPDLDPIAYRHEAHPDLGPTWRELDLVEFALAQGADQRGIPVLGICRGTQALNTVRGGTLHQHLPDVEGSTVQHRQREAGDVLTHTVAIEPGTRLAAITGREELEVNSFHHQAIDRVGDGLIVSARSEDGIAEAIEDPDPGKFFLGVQWHAEFLAEREAERAIFETFFDAACERC